MLNKNRKRKEKEQKKTEANTCVVDSVINRIYVYLYTYSVHIDVGPPENMNPPKCFNKSGWYIVLLLCSTSVSGDHKCVVAIRSHRLSAGRKKESMKERTIKCYVSA